MGWRTGCWRTGRREPLIAAAMGSRYNCHSQTQSCRLDSGLLLQNLCVAVTRMGERIGFLFRGAIFLYIYFLLFILNVQTYHPLYFTIIIAPSQLTLFLPAIFALSCRPRCFTGIGLWPTCPPTQFCLLFQSYLL